MSRDTLYPPNSLPLKVDLSILRGRLTAETLEVQIELVEAVVPVTSKHGQVVEGLA